MRPMASLALLFLVVFALNVVPAFAPPTWMAMSLFGFRHPGADLWLVALVAAAAATGGRLVLAHFAQRITVSRWVRPSMRDSLQGMAELIERRRAASALVFLFFAFSPLPSNALFLAYGLTRAPLRLIAVPFFVGRIASYAAAFAGGSLVSRHIDTEMVGAGSWFYFLATQLALLAIVYAFTRVDWRLTLERRRLHWLP
jgi:membrane protein YqaA with SNARE-associated domain